MPAEFLTNDPVAAAAEGAELVIEVLGGVEVAGQAVTAARLRRSRCYRQQGTAGPAGRPPADLARTHGCLLHYSAAVGGSMPLLERLDAQPGRGVRSIRAVLNGTTNFVIDRWRGE